MVAWDAAVPGTPKSTDGMVSDVVVTEMSPIITRESAQGVQVQRERQQDGEAHEPAQAGDGAQ